MRDRSQLMELGMGGGRPRDTSHGKAATGQVANAPTGGTASNASTPDCDNTRAGQTALRRGYLVSAATLW
jgi:hypothetical protein